MVKQISQTPQVCYIVSFKTDWALDFRTVSRICITFIGSTSGNL